MRLPTRPLGMTGLRVSTLGLKLSQSTLSEALQRAISRGCSLFDLGEADAGGNQLHAAKMLAASVLSNNHSSSSSPPESICVVLRSSATLRDDITSEVNAIQNALRGENGTGRSAGQIINVEGEDKANSPFNLLLLLSNPSLEALELEFFGSDRKSGCDAGESRGARAYAELRDSGDVAATGISCHPPIEDPYGHRGEHHDTVNRFLQDRSFLADVVDTGHASDWSMNHCRLLCHGHRGDEKISADNQLHAAAHLGAAVLLNIDHGIEDSTHHYHEKTASSESLHAPSGRLISAEQFCAERNISPEELAIYLEVGPPSPSPPISATFRGAKTPGDVDKLVEMMQPLHPPTSASDDPDSNAAARALMLQVAADDWMGTRGHYTEE